MIFIGQRRFNHWENCVLYITHFYFSLLPRVKALKLFMPTANIKLYSTSWSFVTLLKLSLIEKVWVHSSFPSQRFTISVLTHPIPMLDLNLEFFRLQIRLLFSFAIAPERSKSFCTYAILTVKLYLVRHWNDLGCHIRISVIKPFEQWKLSFSLFLFKFIYHCFLSLFLFTLRKVKIL